MSLSGEGSLRGFEESDRELRAERRENLRRLREAEERVREDERVANLEIGQGEGGVVNLEQEIGEGRLSEREEYEAARSIPDNQSPIRTPEQIDPLQLILQQFRTLQEGSTQVIREIQSMRDDNAAVIRQMSGRIDQTAKTCTKRHQANSAQIVRNAEKIVEVASKVEQVRVESLRDTADLRKAVSHQVEEVKNAVESIEVSNGGSPRFVDYPRDRRIPDELKFGGRSEKPIIFLKELKANLGKFIHRWEVAKDLIKMYLIGPAREWYILSIDEIDSFATFEAKFRQQFWSIIIQSNVRRTIENGHYSPQTNLTPSEYLIDRRLVASQFPFYKDESEFILMIASHFDVRIQNAVINGNISKVQRLNEVLEAYQSLDQFHGCEVPPYQSHDSFTVHDWKEDISLTCHESQNWENSPNNFWNSRPVSWQDEHLVNFEMYPPTSHNGNSSRNNWHSREEPYFHSNRPNQLHSNYRNNHHPKHTSNPRYHKPGSSQSRTYQSSPPQVKTLSTSSTHKPTHILVHEEDQCHVVGCLTRLFEEDEEEVIPKTTDPQKKEQTILPEEQVVHIIEHVPMTNETSIIDHSPVETSLTLNDNKLIPMVKELHSTPCHQEKTKKKPHKNKSKSKPLAKVPSSNVYRSFFQKSTSIIDPYRPNYKFRRKKL
jgi:hypothetical protein